MLRTLEPMLHDGAYAFSCLVDGVVPNGVSPVVTVSEPEGLTLILPVAEAAAAGLTVDLETAWITLTVHSALDGVGLTAAFSAALADAGIGCNVVAGVFHDHLFVPYARAADAMAALRGLAAG